MRTLDLSCFLGFVLAIVDVLVLVVVLSCPEVWPCDYETRLALQCLGARHLVLEENLAGLELDHLKE